MKEIINTMSRKGSVLCMDDDLGARLLIDQVFGDRVSSMDLP
jgi:hypothetical protein